MKLNKTELTVMASRIYNKLKALAEKAQGECNTKTDVANLKLAESIRASLIRLPLAAKRYMAGADYNGEQKKYMLPTIKKILESFRVTQTKIILPTTYSTEIYEELVLAQIGAENLDAIAGIVTRKFIK